MATKADVKAILKSGKLTGQEAARIVVQHYVDQDHGRGPLLTANEIERTKKAVARRPAEEVDLYNAILEAYRLSEYTLREAHIMALDILLHLERARASVHQVLVAWSLRHEQHDLPTIVTEKQFADLQARQRERKLQTRYCLNQVMAERMWEIMSPDKGFPEDAFGRLSKGSDTFDNVFSQAREEIADLIAEGKLQPVETDFRADDDRLRYPDQEPPPGFETVHWWPEGSQCWSSDTPDEEVDRQLRTYVTGEQLYQAGLPEWRREVDTYRHWQEQEHMPPGQQSASVAVLQEPVGWPVELDERGYYKANDLVRLSGLAPIEEALQKEGRDLKQVFRDQHKWIRKSLREFLAHRPVHEALSNLVGVKLAEDLDTWQAQIEEAVASYVDLLKSPVLQPVPEDLRRWWEPVWLARKPELPTFTIDDLKPDSYRVRQLQERMALPLGDTWWEWLAEEYRLAYEEEAGPAEEVASDGQD